MARSDIDEVLDRVESLAAEIEQFVPNDPKSVQFRADLAGLLVVAIASSYETCVKETLTAYAGRHHSQFAIFTQNHFEKLNSKVAVSDLYKYASTFDNAVHFEFGQLIKRRKGAIYKRIGKDFVASYNQILKWRHDFAHAGIRNTTVEEALATHRLAKRVLYCFDDAFSS
jgi:hypothetical protein